MPLGYKMALQAMQGGARLMVTNADPRRLDSKPVYGLVPSGRQISEAAYRRIKPQLTPCGDGLFGAEFSQTFQWSPQ